eukprot:GHVO01035627.1.p1 GENE.GHVO01035627.1~~GHVO01035627.1.p1  ORF type:complete len:144 (+),score=16.69 GHVO01035627.1:184-615(+)
MADDEDDDDFGGFGGDDSHDIMMPAAMTTNAMAGGRRESKVSSNIRLSRAGDTADNSVLADIVAMGTSADVGDISKELRIRWEKGRIYSNVGSVLLAMNPYRNIFETKSDGSLVRFVDTSLSFLMFLSFFDSSFICDNPIQTH